MKNTMTVTAMSVAILSGGLTAAPAALADFSANIGATSNYVWRGASQTGNNPAIQGGIDYESELGLYAGVWASNVNFGDDYSDAETEVDGYFGWGMDFSEDVGIDLGYVYYHYGQNEIGSDFGEIYGSVSFWWFELGAASTVNDQSCDGTDPDCLNNEDTGKFVAGDLVAWGKAEVEVAEGWTVGLTYGQYAFENDGANLGGNVKADYDYAWGQIDVTRSMEEYGDITLSVSQADTEADGNDHPKVFVGWVKSF